MNNEKIPPTPQQRTRRLYQKQSVNLETSGTPLRGYK
jgi:hypothetical protein